MRTDYAILMEAAFQRQDARCRFEYPSAMAYFGGSYLFQSAIRQIIHEFAHKDALHDVVRTRYPGFAIPDYGERDLSPWSDPLGMAIFANFVLDHEQCCPDASMRHAIHRAIAAETGALLESEADVEGKPGLIRIDERAGCFIPRAGLVSGLAWLHEHLAGRVGETVH